jgi:translocation and assembly module TamA
MVRPPSRFRRPRLRHGTAQLALRWVEGMAFLRILAAALIVFAASILPAEADTPYETAITLTGMTSPGLIDKLKAASQLEALKDHPPPSPAALRRRAEDDSQRLVAVMKAESYWQAQVAFVVDTRTSPAHVTMTVTPGPSFRLAKVAFVLASGEKAPLLQRLGAAAAGLTVGGPALSAPVEAANARIVALYAENGHPFAAINERHAVVDVATDTMAVTYVIEPGAAARFGATDVKGLNRVDREFVTRRIAWNEGAPYDERKVDATRQDLIRSGLFSAVQASHAAAPAADGTVAMTIAVTEGPPRSVGAGAGYNTNVGFGARTFWEHRNLFGEGEDLRLSAGAAQRQLGLAANFRRPDLLVRHQDLVADAELLQEKTDAYNSHRIRGFVGLEELMIPHYTLGGGVSLERAYLTQSTQNENYMLLGTPIYVRRDTTDDLLDPTEGTRSTLTVTPYHGLLEHDFNFVSTRVEGRIYRRIGDSRKYVVAVYAALGSIVGASLAGLPPDKRLYAGGAGSVRGYGYQRAGPLDMNDLPIGGRSSLELGGEFRYRITNTIGIVPFVDAGNVYPGSLPNRASLFYGAGLGLRYYTAIGPVRLDVAFPIGKRGSDSAIQVYISVGQAF